MANPNLTLLQQKPLIDLLVRYSLHPRRARVRCKYYAPLGHDARLRNLAGLPTPQASGLTRSCPTGFPLVRCATPLKLYQQRHSKSID